jgi:hypothetical protein
MACQAETRSAGITSSAVLRRMIPQYQESLPVLGFAIEQLTGEQTKSEGEPKGRIRILM